jgi:hypothetical protein
MDLRTTDAYQEVTSHLLNNERYAYSDTKDKIQNGVVKVQCLKKPVKCFELFDCSGNTS